MISWRSWRPVRLRSEPVLSLPKGQALAQGSVSLAAEGRAGPFVVLGFGWGTAPRGRTGLPTLRAGLIRQKKIPGVMLVIMKHTGTEERLYNSSPAGRGGGCHWSYHSGSVLSCC